MYNDWSTNYGKMIHTWSKIALIAFYGLVGGEEILLFLFHTIFYCFWSFCVLIYFAIFQRFDPTIN